MQSTVISPSCQRMESAGCPKMNLAESSAFASKNGNLCCIALFNAAHASPSVTGSWGKYTWNLGLADLPSFGFMLFRLGTTANATSSPILSSRSSGWIHSAGSSEWELSQSITSTSQERKLSPPLRQPLNSAHTWSNAMTSMQSSSLSMTRLLGYRLFFAFPLQFAV